MSLLSPFVSAAVVLAMIPCIRFTSALVSVASPPSAAAPSTSYPELNNTSSAASITAGVGSVALSEKSAASSAARFRLAASLASFICFSATRYACDDSLFARFIAKYQSRLPSIRPAAACRSARSRSRMYASPRCAEYCAQTFLKASDRCSASTTTAAHSLLPTARPSFLSTSSCSIISPKAFGSSTDGSKDSMHCSSWLIFACFSALNASFLPLIQLSAGLAMDINVEAAVRGWRITRGAWHCSALESSGAARRATKRACIVGIRKGAAIGLIPGSQLATCP